MNETNLVGLETGEHVLEPAGVVGLLVNLALHLAGVAVQALNAHRLLRLGLMIQAKTVSVDLESKTAHV
jgi:hypothetical protein